MRAEIVTPLEEDKNIWMTFLFFTRGKHSISINKSHFQNPQTYQIRNTAHLKETQDLSQAVENRSFLSLKKSIKIKYC